MEKVKEWSLSPGMTTEAANRKTSEAYKISLDSNFDSSHID